MLYPHLQSSNRLGKLTFGVYALYEFLPQIKKIPPDLISFSTFCSVFVLPFTVKFLTEFSIIIILLFTLLSLSEIPSNRDSLNEH